MDINGSTILITGASRGLGKVIATDLAGRGARVALAARSEGDLKDTAEAIRAAGGVAAAIPADISDADDRRRLATEAESELGPIDILINNAAIESIRAFAEMPEQDIHDIVDLNVIATMQLTRLLLPGMLERGRGHLVNISSVAGKAIAPWNSVYSATKHALIGWTASLRVELKGTGVSASVVCPGFVAREGLFARWGDEKTARKSGAFTTPEKVAAAVAKAIEKDVPEIVSSGPVGRIADVALAVSPRLMEAVSKRSPAVSLFRNESERRKREGRSRTE
jgi:short-subunit dehydrogenase